MIGKKCTMNFLLLNYKTQTKLIVLPKKLLKLKIEDFILL